MLLVNNTAVDTATPPQLTHAPWNGGIRMADLVFPWFLFCVGAAIPFASAAFHRKNLPAWRYDLKAATRAALLVLLGCLLDSSLAKRPILDLGVLQIIGLAYLVGALLYGIRISRRMLVVGVLLGAYWAVIRFLPVPGAGVGIFEERQNAILHINLTYLARYNLSGLLSVVPTSAMVLIGTAVGDALRRTDVGHSWKASCLALTGVALMLGGALWNLSLPFNKPVWTPSYILFTAGLGSLALGLFYLLIDIKGWRSWAFPLVVFGSNAILAYVAPILVKVHILQEWMVHVGASNTVTAQQWYLDLWVAHAGRIPGGWIYTATYILVWWLILWVLYRRKLFLRV
jgi:predicted acyltransferase